MAKRKAAKKRGLAGRIIRSVLAVLCLLVIFVTGLGLGLTGTPDSPVALFGWRAVSANDRLTEGGPEPGSLILLRTPTDGIRPGDRVIYPIGYDSYNRIRLAMHPVAAVEEDGSHLVLTDTPLPTVKTDTVFGKEVLIIPHMGDYLAYAATPLGLILVFGVPLVLLMLLQLISLIVGSRRERAEELEPFSEELLWSGHAEEHVEPTQAFSVTDGSTDELQVMKKPASQQPTPPARPFGFERSTAPKKPVPGGVTREFVFPLGKPKPAVKSAPTPEKAAPAPAPTALKPTSAPATPVPHKPYVAVEPAEPTPEDFLAVVSASARRRETAPEPAPSAPAEPRVTADEIRRQFREALRTAATESDVSAMKQSTSADLLPDAALPATEDEELDFDLFRTHLEGMEARLDRKDDPDRNKA